jgi:hypothetical protein
MQQSLILQRLDEVITSLHGDEDPGTHGRGSCDLLLEHLRAARRNLLGSARLEYDLNLEQSLSAVDCIPSKDLRARVKQVLESLRMTKTHRAQGRTSPD